MIHNLSRSLARSRNSQALLVLSAERTDSPISPYMRPIHPCAIANLGSIAVARWKRGRAAAEPVEDRTFQAAL